MSVTYSNPVNILIEDSEIDDMALYRTLTNNLKLTINLHYCVGDAKKFQDGAMKAKSELKQILNHPTPKHNLFTNGYGEADPDDVIAFSGHLLDDLQGLQSIKNLRIIAISQCAPFLDILFNMLSNRIIDVETLEIILVNGGHNGQGLPSTFKRLTTMNLTTKIIVKEFSNYASVQNGSKPWNRITDQKDFSTCSTTKIFSDKVVEYLSDPTNKEYAIANAVIKYECGFNLSLVSQADKNIIYFTKTINSMNRGLDTSELQNIAVSVSSIIKDIVLDKKGIQEIQHDVCDSLLHNIQRVVEIFNTMIKVLLDPQSANSLQSGVLQESKIDVNTLKGFIGWCGGLSSILKNYLLSSPIHDIGAALIVSEHPCLVGKDAWMDDGGKFLNISDKKTELSLYPCKHYVAMKPTKTTVLMEKMVIRALFGDHS